MVGSEIEPSGDDAAMNVIQRIALAKLVESDPKGNSLQVQARTPPGFVQLMFGRNGGPHLIQIIQPPFAAMMLGYCLCQKGALLLTQGCVPNQADGSLHIILLRNRPINAVK